MGSSIKMASLIKDMITSGEKEEKRYYWRCEECDETNSYPEVTECESCGAPIPEAELQRIQKEIKAEEERKEQQRRERELLLLRVEKKKAAYRRGIAVVLAIQVAATVAGFFFRGGWFWLLFGLSTLMALIGTRVIWGGYRNKKATNLYAVFCTVALFGVVLPLHFVLLGSHAWFAPWMVMATLLLLVWSANSDTAASVMFFCCCAGLILLVIFVVGYTVFQRNGEVYYSEKSLFGMITNCIVFAWVLISGLVMGVIRVLAYLIGAALWSDGELIDVVINILMYCLIGGGMVSLYIYSRDNP